MKSLSSVRIDTIMYSYEDIFKNKSKILFVTAHPDDVDVFFGGLIGRLNKDHKDCFILITTNGGRGSKDKIISESQLSEARLTEEKNALAFLQQDPDKIRSLNYLDGEMDSNFELIGKISAVIREFKPEIVCTHDPNSIYFKFRDTAESYINHRDHRVTGTSVLDSIYPFSRDASFFPEQNSTWQVTEILLTGEAVTNTEIDYTSLFDQKRQALLAHVSQFSENSVNSILVDDKKGEVYSESCHYLKLGW